MIIPKVWSIFSPIGSGAGQHFVDAVHVERVGADPDMERILSAVLHQILGTRNVGQIPDSNNRYVKNRQPYISSELLTID